MPLSQKIKNIIIISISLFFLILMQMETSYAQEEGFESSDSSYASDQESSDSSYVSGEEAYSEEATAVEEETTKSAKKNNIKKSKDELSEETAMKSTAMSSTSGSASEKATGGVYSKPESVSVSQIGAATLSYPIDVPPGRNGLQPNITLQYSSYNGNGWIGVGWDFSMGSISRSTKNGLNYSANDYVVDGTELVSRSSDWGTNYYGAKIEGAFTKYLYNSGSNSWIATAKDGTKYYYGYRAYTSNSRMTNANGTFSWQLDRVEDTNGNYMEIDYTIDNGQIYLSSIYYTYHPSFSGYTYRVEFGLEDRPDYINSYKTHSLVTTSKRLKTITVSKANETPPSYKYVLDYNASGPNASSRLRQSQRVNPNNPNNSLPPYEFTYYNGGNGTFNEGSITSLGGPASYRTRNNYVVFGDINGDGIQDFIKAYSPDVGVGVQVSSVTVYPYLANATGGFTAQPVKTLENCPAQYNGVTSMSVALGDINGDGKADIVSSGLSNTVHVYLSNGNGTFSAKITSSGVNNFSNLLSDLDGDGKTDLVMYDSYGTVYTALSNGNGTFGTKVKHQLGVGSGTYYTYSTRIHFADFNGDGKSDIFTFTEYFALPSNKGYKLMIWYANGNGTFNTYYIISDFSVDQIAFPNFWQGEETTCDINGDGLADIA
jgi:hypothetical protein